MSSAGQIRAGGAEVQITADASGLKSTVKEVRRDIAGIAGKDVTGRIGMSISERISGIAVGGALFAGLDAGLRALNEKLEEAVRSGTEIGFLDALSSVGPDLLDWWQNHMPVFGQMTKFGALLVDDAGEGFMQMEMRQKQSRIDAGKLGTFQAEIDRIIEDYRQKALEESQSPFDRERSQVDRRFGEASNRVRRFKADNPNFEVSGLLEQIEAGRQAERARIDAAERKAEEAEAGKIRLEELNRRLEEKTERLKAERAGEDVARELRQTASEQQMRRGQSIADEIARGTDNRRALEAARQEMLEMQRKAIVQQIDELPRVVGGFGTFRGTDSLGTPGSSEVVFKNPEIEASLRQMLRLLDGGGISAVFGP